MKFYSLLLDVKRSIELLDKLQKGMQLDNKAFHTCIFAII